MGVSLRDSGVDSTVFVSGCATVEATVEAVVVVTGTAAGAAVVAGGAPVTGS